MMSENVISQKVGTKISLEDFRKGAIGAVELADYKIFLCGPNATNVDCKDAADLRIKIQQECESAGIEVHLGEDDGLDSLRSYGYLADQNEVQFIKEVVNAVVLIGASVGSFCELGLFARLHAEKHWCDTDFILILKEKYKDDKSYINFGPVLAVESEKSKIFQCEFSTFNTELLLDRLKANRALLAKPAL